MTDNKNLFLACLLFVALTGAGDSGISPPADDGRIVGGHPALEGSAPWQAELFTTYDYTNEDIAADDRLRDNDPGKHFLREKKEKYPWELTHRCGGVLIAENWVLTAAHCIVSLGDFLTTRRIRLGTQDLRLGGATYALARVIVHKDYNSNGQNNNDIALIQITADAKTGPVDATRQRPIRIIGTAAGDRPLSDYDRVAVTGWGLTGARAASGPSTFALDGSREHGSPVLLQVELKALPKQRCEAVPAYKEAMKASVICAGADSAGHDSCNGDSGGPLTRAQGQERVLVGLVSWGKGCALANTPGIYTRVSDYVGWIDAAMKSPAGIYHM